MANPFVAEIRMFAGNFAPLGWAMCNGQLMPISQNTALFSLLGTNFGGDGKSTFGLPNLQGNVPLEWGNGAGLTPRNIGEVGGEAVVTLNQSQIGAHSHSLVADSDAATTNNPAGNLFAASIDKQYSTGAANVQMSPASIGPA